MIKKHLIFFVVFLSVIAILPDKESCGDVTYSAKHDYREEMRKFVEMISSHAKGIDSSFIVIPQNGQELLTLNGEADGEPVSEYISAIDGTGREDLFYGYKRDNVPTPKRERNYMLSFTELAEDQGIQVLAIDYCRKKSFVDKSYLNNFSRGYISFAANHRELDNIPNNPAEPYNVNSLDIESLADARNFLYIINPENFSDKDEFLNKLKQTDYDLFVIDLFFNDAELTSSDIESLKMKSNGGKRLVICYMSIGEAEDYRYYWKKSWEKNPPKWLAKENPDWPGNYKVRFWNKDWQGVIYGNENSYLTKILNAGFDGVYLDIIDAFEYFENR